MLYLKPFLSLFPHQILEIDSPKNFLNTPDDRPRWSSYFLQRGYTIYLTDSTKCGRSPASPTDGTFAILPVSFVTKYFTASEKFPPPEWPQATLHNQFPGTGLPGDPYFEAFYRSQVQLQLESSISDPTNQDAQIALLESAGPAVLLTHSQSGPWGFSTGDARPDLVKGIIAIEPEGPPFVNEIGPEGSARVDGLTRLPLE